MQPYLSLEAELHDAFWENEDDTSELRLLTAFLTEHPGPSLEIGSGSGRLLIPLVAEGFHVDGLELSPDMLALTRAKAAEQHLSPTLHQGDMSTWFPEKPYASLLAPAFTLQLAADPAATLRHWKTMLIPGGALYLTLFTPFAELLDDLPEGQWYPDHELTLTDGSHALLETRHTLHSSALTLTREHRYTLTQGKTQRTHSSTQTIHYRSTEAWVEMLQDAGFHLTHLFADFDPEFTDFDDTLPDYDGIITLHAKAGQVSNLSLPSSP